MGSVSPSYLPSDIRCMLDRFQLSIGDLLTPGSANAKLAKGGAVAAAVIHHQLPARSLAAAVAGETAAVAVRSRIDSVRDLAIENGLLGDAQRHNGCPWASNGCRDGCLVWAGHGGLSTDVAACRARRTLAYIWSPQLYGAALLWAIAASYRRHVVGRGEILAVRLRGTDDNAYHRLAFNITAAEAATIYKRFGLVVPSGNSLTLADCLREAMESGQIRWYEYTKAPVAVITEMAGLGIDVTASLAADRQGGARAAVGAVRAGFRLAVPIAIAKGSPIPSEMRLAPTWGMPAADGPGFGLVPADDRSVRLRCIDGDTTDHRWADPAGPGDGFDGVAVILRTKRSRGRDASVSDPFSLRAISGWQTLKGGGFAWLP